MNAFFGRLLYPTVGAALFVAWGFARKWEERGLHRRAKYTRAAVVVVAIYPLVWALREVYRSLGMEATLYVVGGSAVAVVLLLAASALGRWGKAQTTAEGRARYRQALLASLLGFVCIVVAASFWWR